MKMWRKESTSVLRLITYVFLVFYVATFVSEALDSVEYKEKIINKRRSKLALTTRHQRRTLFQNALDEHYHHILVAKNNYFINNDNTKGFNGQYEGCIFYSNHQSDWTIAFCPGRFVSKLNLIPIAKGSEVNKENEILMINGNLYYMTESLSLGIYPNNSTLVETNENIDGMSLLYMNGDLCESIVPTISMKRATVIESNEACCQESIRPDETNYYSNQITDDGYTIIKFHESSGTCRYRIELCKVCDMNNFKRSLNQTNTIGAKRKRNETRQNIIDLYTHLADNDVLSINIDGTKTFASSSMEIVQNLIPRSFPPMPPSRVESNIQLIKSMFQHAYDSYMYNAFPASELKPKSCKGGLFHLIRLPALTLIDSLDTLLLMKNYTEFARSVERLRALDLQMKSDPIWEGNLENGGLFAVNQNVSVFETNIRVLGGLLSAHQMAEVWTEATVLIDEVFNEDRTEVLIGEQQSAQESSEINFFIDNNIDLTPNETPSIYSELFLGDQICTLPPDFTYRNTTETRKIQDYWSYDGYLLSLAHDIGRRLLPAFESKTGIPYGTVNLLYGIPHQETPIASLAGAGSLSVEMELLSRLTGDPSFGNAAKLASRALWLRRSPENSLFGKHIDVETGRWTETLSGLGSNSDSFYEYLLKHYILYPEDFDFFELFHDSYIGIFNNTRRGDWYPDTEMALGSSMKGSLFESLVAFYPGLQVLLGELNPSASSENSFLSVRETLKFLPERFDFLDWIAMKGHDVHPLRPEVHESCYFLHMATKDNTLKSTSNWLWSADFSVRELEKRTKTSCGYASVDSISNSDNKETMLLDDMPSYFLSETLKYFYLSFDSLNPLHNDNERNWVFTTEAHPIHNVALSENEAESKIKKSKRRITKILKARLFRNTNKEDAKGRESVPAYSDNFKLPGSITKGTWAIDTKMNQYIQGYREMMDKKHNLPSQNEDETDLFFLRHIKNDTFSDMTFATFDQIKDGRGAFLGKTCPNYHHPNSHWAHALTGNQFDYTDLFMTRFLNDDDDLRGKTLPTVTSSALFGLLTPDNHNKCNLGDRYSGDRDENKKETHSVPPGMQRIDMGQELGSFDISVHNGEGFYIKHINSGETIEATLVANSEDQSAFLAVDSLIRGKRFRQKHRNLFLDSLKFSLTNVKSVFSAKKNNQVSLPSHNHHERKVIISDTNNHAFSCQLNLIHEAKDSMTKEYDEKSLGIFPCLPATFGPTTLSKLTKHNGISYEAELSIPNTHDLFGCSTNLMKETSDDLNNKNPRIEMVNRGKCNFRSKSLNIGSRNNVMAVIVINTDDKLFVMAGPEEAGYDYSNEPATILITKNSATHIYNHIDELKISTNNRARIKARINILPIVENTGKHKTWPQIHSTQNLVQILASQGWGVTAKSEQGQWSLFVVKHEGEDNNITDL